MTARSTPGSPIDALCEPSIACPRKKATKLVMIPTTKARTVATAILLKRKVPRCGTAESEVRIMPVLYSFETTSTPNTIIAS